MHIERLFSVPLGIGEVDVDNQSLIDYVLQYKDQRLSDINYHSEYEDTYLPPNEITNTIVNKVIQDFYDKGETDLVCTGMWSHIHEKNMSTNWHTHHKCFSAVVYYVSVPEGSGDLVLRRHDQPKVSLTPKQGNYICFPGWLEHMVTRNETDQIRISISFNLNHGH